jgi:hypothetical protein
MIHPVPEMVDVVGIAAIIYGLVMVANNQIPYISTKDNPIVFENDFLNIVKQDIFDTIGNVINLDNLHCGRLVVGLLMLLEAISAIAAVAAAAAIADFDDFKRQSIIC